MNLWLGMKIFFHGRASAAKELARARREAIKEGGRRSFVSGRKAEEWHHGFDVTTFPFFADSSWNLWPMTAKEHAAFHRWRGGTWVWCTPVHLYFWKYCIYHWWKSVIFFSVSFYCYSYFFIGS